MPFALEPVEKRFEFFSAGVEYRSVWLETELSRLPVHSAGLCAVRGSDHHSGHASQHRQEVPPTNGLSCFCNQEVLWQESNMIGSRRGRVHRLAVPLVNNPDPASLRRESNELYLFCCRLFAALLDQYVWRADNRQSINTVRHLRG